MRVTYSGAYRQRGWLRRKSARGNNGKDRNDDCRDRNGKGNYSKINSDGRKPDRENHDGGNHNRSDNRSAA